MRKTLEKRAADRLPTPRRIGVKKIVREAGVLAARALCVLAEATVLVAVVTGVAGGVIPWCMVALAAGLGVGPETSVMDLIFVYGASAAFVVAMVSATTWRIIRLAYGALRTARDGVVARLRGGDDSAR